MSYFRSYFEKNNTIVKDSQTNTSKNPNTDIFFGSSFSKYIFKVNFSDLKTKTDNDDLVLNLNTTKHYLKMTNTIFGDEALIGQNGYSGRLRATSFDLIIFKIPEFWDEGYGFDYDQVYDFNEDNNTFDQRPSNWYNRTTLSAWTINGIYNASPNIITTVHFDNGNENLDVDITNYVNGVLTGATDHGLGVAFSVPYQLVPQPVDQSVSFFTKYTQTFFEPYVESVFEDRIDDDRFDFIEDLQQNLYLYVTKNGNYINLDSVPTVDILNHNNTPISGLTGITSTLVRKGVYKVTFGISGINCDGKKFFSDVWKNIFIEGVQFDNTVQKFIPKPLSSGFSIGVNQTDLERYSIQYFGVNQNEKIKRGEERKVVVTFRSINTPKSVLLDEVHYRIYVNEGLVQVNVHDWTKVDKTNENSFVLNTSYLIPREYTLEIKGKTFTEEIFYKDKIKFEIVSEK